MLVSTLVLFISSGGSNTLSWTTWICLILSWSCKLQVITSKEQITYIYDVIVTFFHQFTWHKFSSPITKYKSPIALLLTRVTWEGTSTNLKICCPWFSISVKSKNSSPVFTVSISSDLSEQNFSDSNWRHAEQSRRYSLHSISLELLFIKAYVVWCSRC